MTFPSFFRRCCAFLIDGVIALLFFMIGWWGGLLAVAYLVFRDGLWGGQSIGKRILSLRVVERGTGSGIGFIASLKRNVVFAVPLLNVAVSVAVFEGVLAYFEGEGSRLGDRIAGTRVMQS